MKEPGQIAYEAYEDWMDRPWGIVGGEERESWQRVEAAVEAAVRADERERCAKVAEGRFKDHADTLRTARAANYEHAGSVIAAAIRNLGESGA